MFKIEKSRKQPGDLFLFIVIGNLLQNAHWFITALGSPWSGVIGEQNVIFDSALGSKEVDPQPSSSISEAAC